ncbi:MAG: hypothetical protein CM1200mP30_15560 [Pseudomonadota bacterium]|nr:MAG: hypothetical protein CM1200mP30_15560 [Pseudomonadota bacterium]
MVPVPKFETLEIVFKNSVWGAAIGGVSGVAIWALQEDDKEDKFFPKYVVRGMAMVVCRNGCWGF